MQMGIMAVVSQAISPLVGLIRNEIGTNNGNRRSQKRRRRIQED
jgi:hypothetical protein